MQQIASLRRRPAFPSDAVGLVGWLFCALLLSGCASSQRIISQWSNPAYGPASSFKRIVVMGVTDETSVRRNFEDQLVAKLRAAGVDTVPSYHYLPENAMAEKPRLEEAVRRARADAALITRLVRVEEKTEIDPGYYDPAPARAFGFYHWYSSAWYGYYRPPRLYRYEVYVTETTLYDTAKDEVVWTATIKTIPPDDFSEAIDEYVETVVNALKEQNLLLA